MKLWTLLLLSVFLVARVNGFCWYSLCKYSCTHIGEGDDLWLPGAVTGVYLINRASQCRLVGRIFARTLSPGKITWHEYNVIYTRAVQSNTIYDLMLPFQESPGFPMVGVGSFFTLSGSGNSHRVVFLSGGNCN